MLKILCAAALGVSGVAISAAAPAALSPAAAAGSESVCKFVTTPERGAKPFEMCLTRDQWAQKEARDSKDPNRIVCRYEDVPGSKLKGRKICQPASQWAEDRAMHREQVEAMQQKACVPGAGC